MEDGGTTNVKFSRLKDGIVFIIVFGSFALLMATTLFMLWWISIKKDHKGGVSPPVVKGPLDDVEEPTLAVPSEEKDRQNG